MLLDDVKKTLKAIDPIVYYGLVPSRLTDENGEDPIAIRPMMNIQLSVDHRVIDGLLASQFVEYMKQLLENPVKILM